MGFPGGPVKTSLSNAKCMCSIPGQEAKIPRSTWPKNQNIKQKQYCNKFNKRLQKWSKLKKKILKKKKKKVCIGIRRCQENE